MPSAGMLAPGHVRRTNNGVVQNNVMDSVVSTMNILIINQGHTDNVGDIAIARSIEAVARNRSHNTVIAPYDFELISNKALNLSKQFERILRHVPAVRERLMRREIGNFLKGEQFDAAIIGGGELLGGSFSSFSIALHAWAKALREMHIPVYAFGISGSIPDKRWVRDRYKTALKMCDMICVRDKASLNLVKDYYGILNCQLAPDVVFSYRLTHEMPARIRDERKASCRVMCVPAPFTKETMRYLNIFSLDEFCDYIIEFIIKSIRGMQVSEVVFTSTTLEDSEVVSRLVDRCKTYHSNSFDVMQIIPNGNLDDFLVALSNTRLVVSGRMHACILGLLSGCDYVAIPCKNKLKTFASEYASEIDLQNIELEALGALTKCFSDMENRSMAKGEL